MKGIDGAIARNVERLIKVELKDLRSPSQPLALSVRFRQRPVSGFGSIRDAGATGSSWPIVLKNSLVALRACFRGYSNP